MAASTALGFSSANDIKAQILQDILGVKAQG